MQINTHRTYFLLQNISKSLLVYHHPPHPYPSGSVKEKGNVELSFMHRTLIWVSLMGSVWGEPSWEMNSWLRALQNAHEVNVTSNKALKTKDGETHAGNTLGQKNREWDSWTNCRYSCSRGWRLKTNVTSHWMRLMNFWLGNLTLKLISQFSGGRHKSWAADRCTEHAVRQCPQKGCPPRTAVFPAMERPASAPGCRELVWALENHLTPFLISPPTASPLFWSCPTLPIIAQVTTLFFVFCSTRSFPCINTYHPF